MPELMGRQMFLKPSLLMQTLSDNEVLVRPLSMTVQPQSDARGGGNGGGGDGAGGGDGGGGDGGGAGGSGGDGGKKFAMTLAGSALWTAAAQVVEPGGHSICSTAVVVTLAITAVLTSTPGHRAAMASIGCEVDDTPRLLERVLMKL